MRQKLMVFIILSLLLFGVSNIQAEPNRPETGTYIKDTERDGYGILTIHNNWTMDTVGVLTDEDVKPLLAVYIRTKDSIEITGIRDGEYRLYFTIGTLWDAKTGTYRNVYGYYRYNQPLEFETDDAGNEIEYSVFSLNLYEAGASNFVPDQFQFPDLRS